MAIHIWMCLINLNRKSMKKVNVGTVGYIDHSGLSAKIYVPDKEQKSKDRKKRKLFRELARRQKRLDKLNNRV